jgi:ribbon-helix-helix CopG family protein
MSKKRRSPPISKPMVDEETALKFALAAFVPVSTPAVKSHDKPPEPASKKGSYDDIGKDMRRISITLKRNLYERIAKDAARKGRTVGEHLERHLTKYYSK